MVARLPKLEDNENDETNNDNESETQNTSSCSHNETTESILHRNEIQSSLFNSEENEDNHSPSTCSTVDGVTPSINQNPAKSNARSQTKSDIETSSLSSPIQQTPISNEINPPKVNNGYRKGSASTPTSLQVLGTVGAHPISKLDCVKAIFHNGGVCIIGKDRIPSGYQIEKNATATPMPFDVNIATAKRIGYNKSNTTIGHVCLPVNLPSAASLSRDKRNSQNMTVWIDFQVLEHCDTGFVIGIDTLQKVNGFNVLMHPTRGVIITNVPYLTKPLRIPIADNQALQERTRPRSKGSLAQKSHSNTTAQTHLMRINTQFSELQVVTRQSNTGRPPAHLSDQVK